MTRGELTPGAPVRFLPGVGPARARVLVEAGYETVGDLLFHLPLRYEDRRRVAAVGEVGGEGPVTVRGHLRGLRAVRTRRRGLTLVRGTVEDASGRLAAVWFNRPYLVNQVSAEREYLLHGQVRAGRDGRPELLNPSCEPAEAALHCGRVAPIYPAVGSLGPAFLRRLMGHLLERLDPAAAVPEPLPEALLDRYRMPPLGEALAALHLPGPEADAELLNRRRSPAHLRLIYGELLELQLELALVRGRRAQAAKAHAYRVDDAVRELARSLLPFRLTGAQRRALAEIVADLESPRPMERLLQGDVGSGKTIVAALAFVVAMESGLQGAFMAPTELLAEQHFANLRRLLGERYRLGLLTASSPAPEEVRRGLARGEVQLVVGTHALIQEGVELRRLGLAVVDEQHRFGVHQRRLLSSKGERPDLLVMTATPIPRSLALTLYGDLELSVIDELPPGRQPVATEVLPASHRGEVYARLAREVAAGARVYVVFPLIDESREIDAEAVAALGEKLRSYLAPHPSAVLHGRLPAEERERVMGAFARGEVQVLVATTVIEVGVDVPAATVMVIESAERFGLAQLHQLRGRVGRGEGAARCIALHGRLSREGRRRLEVFAATTDGFEIAEADLLIRGPGDLLGTRQAGLPTFRVADLAADQEWLVRARDDARELLARLDEPACAALRRRVTSRAEDRLRALSGG